MWVFALFFFLSLHCFFCKGIGNFASSCTHTTHGWYDAVVIVFSLVWVCVWVKFFGVWKPFSKSFIWYSFATIKNSNCHLCVNNRKCLHFSCFCVCVFVVMRSLLLLLCFFVVRFCFTRCASMFVHIKVPTYWESIEFCIKKPTQHIHFYIIK